MSRNIHIPAPKYKVGYTQDEIFRIYKLIGVGECFKFTVNDLVEHKGRELVNQKAIIREIRRVKNGENGKFEK